MPGETVRAQQQLPDLRLARVAPRFVAGGGPRRWQRVFPKATAAAVVWLAGYALATWLVGSRQPASDLLNDIVYLVPIAIASGLSILAAHRARGSDRWFWSILAASNILWLFGELTWGFYEIILNRPTPFPSLADVLYVSSYVLVIPAIVVGFQGAIRRRAWRALLDASVMVAAIGITGYTLLIRPQLAYGFSLATATGVAYPLLGVAILMVLTSHVFAGNRVIPGWARLVTAAFAASALTDAAYTYFVVLHGVSGTWMNLGWQLEAVLLCLAAVEALRHPSDEPIPDVPHRDVGLPIVLCGMLLVLVVVGVDAFDRRLSVESVVLAAYAVVAVVARLSLTSQQAVHTASDLGTAVEELRRVEDDRRRLLDNTVRALEDERRRLAWALHDGPIQRLAALTFKLETLRVRLADEDAAEHSASVLWVQTGLNEEIQQLRRVMADLRPPVLDQGGLRPALQDLATQLIVDHGVTCSVEWDAPDRLDPALETVLYRVAQEALANVVAHAETDACGVEVRDDRDRLALRIWDRGRGFHPESMTSSFASHLGVAAMQERVEMAGGTWRLRSDVGAGTTIEAEFPRSAP